MENLPVFLPHLSADDWALTIDLSDAYLHVLIHQDSLRLLGVQYLNQTFLYQVLPFGLKDSPWVFHQNSSKFNFLPSTQRASNFLLPIASRPFG